MVVSRPQLASFGYDNDATRRRAMSGEWQQVGNAFVLHSGIPSDHQLQWAAVLTAPGLAASVQQRIVPTSALRQELAAAGAIRHGRILRSILADIEGGADSLSEIDFVVLARKAGLPPPIRQSIRYDSAGRRRYLDADFGTFVVEVDGGVHLHAPNYWADARRQNELVLGGDRILRFSSYAIRVEEDVVIAQLRRAHQVFG